MIATSKALHIDIDSKLLKEVRVKGNLKLHNRIFVIVIFLFFEDSEDKNNVGTAEKPSEMNFYNVAEGKFSGGFCGDSDA